MKQEPPEKVTFITSKGLEKLQNELEYLKTDKRKEIASFLQETQGDVEETEYLIALEEQAFVEGRILQIEQLLSNVKVIQPSYNNKGIVDVGSTVVLQEGNADAETYTIVGAAEANPEMGLISNESPLGKELLGSSVGDELEIKAPAGLLKFRVLAIQ